MSSYQSPTPQPFRDLNSEGARFGSTLQTEVWDDMANVVYSVIDPTSSVIVPSTTLVGPFASLAIGCPVPARLEIHAKMLVSKSTGAFPSAYVNWVVGESSNTIIDGGVSVVESDTADLLTTFGTVDVAPGIHTYAITYIANDDTEISLVSLMIRRGRKPPTIGVST